jgi:type II secretory pathway pseudopilin PulG
VSASACAAAPRRLRARTRQGYTYIVLMVLLAILAVAASLTIEVAETTARRSAEAELLAIGREFDAAFASYARQSPPGTSRYPRTLADLVRDPRTAGMRRHLRRIYPDPITGTTDWRTIASPDGGIMAVSSNADGRPLREVATPYAEANGASAPAFTYGEWLFGAVPELGPNTRPIYPTPAASASAGGRSP